MSDYDFFDPFTDEPPETGASPFTPIPSEDLLAPSRSFCAAWGLDTLPWPILARALFEGERRLRAAGANKQSRRLRSLFARWGLLAHWAAANATVTPAAQAVESALRGMSLSLAEPLRRAFAAHTDWENSSSSTASRSTSSRSARSSTGAKTPPPVLDDKNAEALKGAIEAAIASADFLLNQAPGAFQDFVDQGKDPQREGLLLFAAQAEKADASSWPSVYSSAKSRAPADPSRAITDLDRLSERPDALLRSAFQSQRFSNWLLLITFEVALMTLCALGPSFVGHAPQAPNWRHALFSAGARAFFGFAAGGAAAQLVEIFLIYKASADGLRQAMLQSLRLREGARRALISAVCFGALALAAPFWI